MLSIRIHPSAHQIFAAADRILIAVILIAVLVATPALGQSAKLFSPDEMTSGALLLESSTKGRFVAAPLIAADVDIDVSGPFARVQVTQRFENPGDGWIEGVYVFPLPENAAVDTLKMQIGDRFIEGVIEERKKAKEIYEAAKAEGKKASLLEQERPNIFTNSVANIGPGETVVIQIEYQEVVRIDGDVFSLRFPMVVAPRFNPAPLVQTVSFEEGAGGWGYIDPVPDRARIEPDYLNPAVAAPVNPVSVSVDIDAGFPLGPIEVPSHSVHVARRDEARATLTLDEEIVPADRDFELRWSPKSGTAPSAALFSETVAGEEFFVLMVTPPAGVDAIAPVSREVVFVLDTSGSMAGESIRQAKSSLQFALDRLRPGDRFNVIEFNSTHRALFPASVAISDATRAQAKGFVAALNADGGTNILPALETALRDNGGAKGEVRQVVFLTDGAIGNEQQLFETISQKRGRARVFTVGIGSAPNSFFMSRAAEVGRGAFAHIAAVDQVAARMAVLFEKLESPVLTDLQLTAPDGAIIEAWPNPIPDVYKGEPVIVAIKADAAGGLYSLTGVRGDTAWRADIPATNASRRKGASKLWARRKIASLELDIARDGNSREANEVVIVETALTHSLVSRLTSLVALDVTPSRPAEASLATATAPLNLPAGWEFDKVFGERVDRLQREAAAGESFEKVALRLRDSKDAAARSVAGNPAAGIVLPQGSTLADVKIGIGILLILLATAVFLTLSSVRVSKMIGARP